MEKVTKNRVVGYCRVSTEEQSQHGYSIDAQQEQIKDYCRLYEKKLVSTYVDAGLSGKEMTKRPELQRLLEDATLDKFDEVVVWKINRLSRNTKDLLEVVDVLNKNNVSFTSISEKFDTATPMGRFALQMMGATGELERNTIVENINLALTQRAKLGLHSGGVALGYDLVPSKTRHHKNDLVINPEEAKIVQRIYEMFAEGHGLHYIVDTLNAEGITTKRGKTFSYFGIKTIIENPLYKGYVRYGMHKNWAEMRRKGKQDEFIYTKGIHEPIISEELWERVARIRRTTSRDTPNLYGNLLTSILRCPVCNGPMHIVYSGYFSNKFKKRIKYRNYHCKSNVEHKGCPCNMGVKADDAEEFVIKVIKRIVEYPDFMQKLVKEVLEPQRKIISTKEQQVASIDKRLADIRRRKEKLIDLYGFDNLSKEILDERLDELAKNERELLANKEKLTFQDDDKQIKISEDEVKAVLANFDQVFEEASMVQKRSLLRLIIDHITVKDKKIDKIYIKIGDDIVKYLNNGTPLTYGKGLFICIDSLHIVGK